MLNAQVVRRQFVTQSNVSVVVGTPITLQFQMPAGYAKWTELQFDPDADASVTVFAQKANSNVMTGFSTKIGSALGIARIDYQLPRGTENEVLDLTYTPVVVPAGKTRFAFTCVFE